MAQPRSAASTLPAPRVQVIAPERLGATAIAALRARGIDARAVVAHLPSAIDASQGVVAWALDAIPTTTATLELAETCSRAASAGYPVCLLVPAPRGTGRGAVERAAAIAYLHAHGAAIGHDVDTWLESVVLLVRFGLPPGPHAAVIAPAGSWLESQAITLATEAVGLGARPPVIGDSNAEEPTDVALYDPALGLPPSSSAGLFIPVIARAEIAGDVVALYGVRGAIGAIAMLGHAAARIAVGIGPAPRTASAELAIDHEKLDRQLKKRGERSSVRVGDHETKVLLSAYVVPITRQAVATTPSAAVKVARKVNYPVEIKLFGDDVPPEPGCLVETDITSDALVRKAFGAVTNGHDNASGVIVRETPPSGRELSVSLVRLPALGWTIVVDAPGAPQLAAAPCPLRLIDANSLARQVVASRAGDPEPDRIGLANILRRVSHLVVDLDTRLLRLELPRVIVGGRGTRTLVVDAFAELT